MTEHRGTSFYNSCVKVPVDPYSRQPTPSYERPQVIKTEKPTSSDKGRKINFVTNDQSITESESSSSPESLEDFLEFLESIPDYQQIHHLTNEQFKQKVEYLRRKQRSFLKNLRNSSDDVEKEIFKSSRNCRTTREDNEPFHFKLNGKKCYIEESRSNSPLIFYGGSFADLTEDQDFLTYRCKDKEAKSLRNKEIYSSNKEWNDLKNDESLSNDTEDSIETKSLPAYDSKEWHPTVPKPFSFTLREEAEKYMARAEMEEAQHLKQETNKKKITKKRRVRPIPLTSKIPLYDKLLAEKEERSRMVREESALNLMSQVRPFKLECDRRAWRSLTRSSPEICSKNVRPIWRFKAKPVPRNLFGTEVYDRMLEDEYYRQLTKRLRAAELMKSSSLPPSMARRERVKSACARLQDSRNRSKEVRSESRESSRLSNLLSDGCRSAMNILPGRNNNLAAVLRCQASRDKLEREIRQRMEEKRREQVVKMKEMLIGRQPAWRALRSAARHDHERDLDIRASQRRDEAREQAERHRLQMEMMLDRVTQIPTLFERHSQVLSKLQQSENSTKNAERVKKKTPRRRNSSETDSFVSYGSSSSPSSQLSKYSRETLESEKSADKIQDFASNKKRDRGARKVSIRETAELIEDRIGEGNGLSWENDRDLIAEE